MVTIYIIVHTQVFQHMFTANGRTGLFHCMTGRSFSLNVVVSLIYNAKCTNFHISLFVPTKQRLAFSHQPPFARHLSNGVGLNILLTYNTGFAGPYAYQLAATATDEVIA
jgi:hypothetical protein